VKRNTIVVIVVILTVTGMLVLGRRMSKQQAGLGLAPTAQALPTEVKGALAPEFALASLPDKKPVKLSDFKGKAVLLNFWATWCEPCKIEMPWFIELQHKYGPQGLQVIGIAEDDSGPEAITKFAQEMKVDYPILQGKNVVGDAYGAEFLPTTVYIGRDGKIVDRVTGLASKSEIEDNIKKALAQQ
jgi:thiol-disulfide isomerase/thioredoxin